MKVNNPVFIPRNHLVEEALDEAVSGNLSLFEEMLSLLAKPYDYKANYAQYLAPPAADFDQDYQTFCGT
jgi:serine/tyrosine/threonine adenylyltransferase